MILKTGKSMTLEEALETEECKDRCRTAVRSIVPPDDGQEWTTILSNSLELFLGVCSLRKVCNHSVKEVFAVDAEWRKGHETSLGLIRLKLDGLKDQFAPIEYLVERVQNLVALRQLRGKPWNRPRETREVLVQGRSRLHSVLIEMLQYTITERLAPYKYFLETLEVPQAYIINALGVDDPKGATTSVALARWFLEDPGWARIAAARLPPPPFEMSPIPVGSGSPSLVESSPSPSPLPPSDSTGRKPAPSVSQPARPSLPSPASSSANDTPKTPTPAGTGSNGSKAKPSSKAASAPRPGPNSVAPSVPNGSAKAPAASMSTATLNKLKTLRQEQARLETKIAAMKHEVERLRKPRQSMDQFLQLGIITDAPFGTYQNRPRPAWASRSSSLEPDKGSHLVSKYFANLPEDPHLASCAPHLHSAEPDALEALDSVLASIFSSSLAIQVHQVDAPLILESVRDAALKSLYNRYIDWAFDPWSEVATRGVRRILDAALGAENLFSYQQKQIIGNNALPEALLEARMQIQVAVRLVSPKADLKNFMPCVCELSNYLWELEALADRLERAVSATEALKPLRPGTPLDRARWIELTRSRSERLGPEWQGEKLEQKVDATLRVFDEVWESSLVEAQPRFESLSEGTAALVQRVGGYRMWEESWRVLISAEASDEDVMSRISTYERITTLLIKDLDLANKLSLSDLAEQKKVADKAMQQKKYAEAIEIYDALALLSPKTYLAASTNAALARNKQEGDHFPKADLAISDCSAALANGPYDSVKALYRRGLAYAAVKRPIWAMEDLEAARDTEPNLKKIQIAIDRLRERHVYLR